MENQPNALGELKDWVKSLSKAKLTLLILIQVFHAYEFIVTQFEGETWL